MESAEWALSESRREDIWEALSEAFNDNDVDYAWMARQVADIPRSVLKDIFFSEVAPQCAFNVFAVIPPVWTGFDRRSLAGCVREMKLRNRHSLLSRLRHSVEVAFYRVRFRAYWRRIEAELGANRP